MYDFVAHFNQFVEWNATTSSRIQNGKSHFDKLNENIMEFIKTQVSIVKQEYNIVQCSIVVVVSGLSCTKRAQVSK